MSRPKGSHQKPHTKLHKQRIGDANRGKKYSEEICQKFSRIRKITHNKPEVKEKIGKCKKGKTYEEIYGLEKAKELRKKRSLTFIDYWASSDAREAQRKRVKIIWATPNSKLRSEEAIEKQRMGQNLYWADPNNRKTHSQLMSSIYENPTLREKRGQCTKRAWADANSKFNSTEYQENFNKMGYGYCQFSSDGHRCSSILEFIFEEWLITNNLEHYPHPLLPNGGRRADQLVNNTYYIEIDGMNRSKEFWDKKYGKLDIKPIILKIERLASIYDLLNDNLLQTLKEEVSEKISKSIKVSR